MVPFRQGQIEDHDGGCQTQPTSLVMRDGRGAAAFLLLLVLAMPVTAESAQSAEPRLSLSGNFRFRLESDFDSQRADGSERSDRDRARIRARLKLKAALSESISCGLRLRTGSRDSQQSPHITVRDFDDNSRGDSDLLLDQWFVRVEKEGSWGWLGRNGFPFWKQNELFWDDDVTPLGLAAGHSLAAGTGTLKLIGGYFTLPDGGVDFNGRLAAAQAIYSRRWGRFDNTAALGLFLFAGEEGSSHLRSGNGQRDYAIWLASLQTETTLGERALKLGLDLLHNAEGYGPSASDPLATMQGDQTEGFVASIQWGEAKQAGHWLFGYYFARIEALAVNASYAQDDWLRWGSATQTDASDFRGHELRLSYGLSAKAKLVARFYQVEAISSVQDGSRARIDFELSF